MKDTELLETKVTMLEIETRSLERNIDRVDKRLGEFETVVRDLLDHLELEFYTEKIDGYWPGHGVREVSKEIKEYREQRK